MKPGTDDFERRGQIVAGLLRYGTWLATALVAFGLLLTLFEPVPRWPALPLSGHDAMRAGIVMFISLPIARVALLLAIFLQERDYAYTAIAALVLAIIAAGLILEA